MEEQVKLKLFCAARAGDLQKLKRLKDSAAQVYDTKSREGNTVLHLAARFGHRQMVEMLITDRQSLVLQCNSKGETPLHVAARAGKHEVVELLIDLKGDDSWLRICWIRDNSGNMPLHGAVRNGHLKVVRLLAKKDPSSLRWLNDRGESPLSIAIDMKWTNLAEAIIHLNNSTLEYRGKKDETPLHCATMRQEFDILTTIVKFREDLIEEPDEMGRTALHYAAALGHQKMVEVLIGKKPWVAYTKDKNGQIPLHLAAKNGQKRLIEALREPCPETIEIDDGKHQNIVHIAANYGNVDVVSHILDLPEMDDLVNSGDKNGNTPLHLAASNFHSVVVAILSKNLKVEIRATNNIDRTAMAIVKSSVDRGMELQKHLTLKALKSAYRQKSINFEDAPELDDEEVGMPKKDGKTDRENVEINEPKKNGEKSRQMAQTISVMSTLIATFTFTAAFTIPGGFINDGPDEGLAVLVRKSAFQAFVITDAIAMTSSITAAVIVFWSSSRRDTESFLDILPFAIGLTWTSLIAMALAFVTGLFVVLHKTLWLAILVCVIGCGAPFILYILSPIYVTVFETSPSDRKNIVGDNPFVFIWRLLQIFVDTQIYFRCKCLCKRVKGQVNRVKSPQNLFLERNHAIEMV